MSTDPRVPKAKDMDSEPQAVAEEVEATTTDTAPTLAVPPRVAATKRVLSPKGDAR